MVGRNHLTLDDDWRGRRILGYWLRDGREKLGRIGVGPELLILQIEAVPPLPIPTPISINT